MLAVGVVICLLGGRALFATDNTLRVNEFEDGSYGVRARARARAHCAALALCALGSAYWRRFRGRRSTCARAVRRLAACCSGSPHRTHAPGERVAGVVALRGPRKLAGGGRCAALTTRAPRCSHPRAAASRGGAPARCACTPVCVPAAGLRHASLRRTPSCAPSPSLRACVLRGCLRKDGASCALALRDPLDTTAADRTRDACRQACTRASCRPSSCSSGAFACFQHPSCATSALNAITFSDAAPPHARSIAFFAVFLGATRVLTRPRASLSRLAARRRLRQRRGIDGSPTGTQVSWWMACRRRWRR